MNKIKFFEALYTSCNSIVARRKSVVIPILTIVAGVALPIISTSLLDGAEYDNINSVVILAGIALAVAGGVWTLGRLTGNGEPYSTKSGKFWILAYSLLAVLTAARCLKLWVAETWRGCWQFQPARSRLLA